MTDATDRRIKFFQCPSKDKCIISLRRKNNVFLGKHKEKTTNREEIFSILSII
jgi:hypothetical protein